MKSRTICILYGINEGPGIGRAFERACNERGFEIIRNPAEADIIFAHSGGCFLVPPQNNAKLVIQVGIAYWPGKIWLLATLKKIQLELRTYGREKRLKAWIRKLGYHARYACNLGSALQMARNLSPDKPWNNAQPQVIVRNREDVYCSPNVHLLHYRGPRTFISLPGEHDDCWEHPERYLSLIQSLYE
jgi:hypothetical protein